MRLAYGKQGEIGRELIRKFLLLYAKAERSELTEQEEAEWAEISRRVDYKRFTIERSPPRYVSGILLDHTDQRSRLEWHDGAKELVTGKAARAFQLLEPGERFTALARFGAGNTLVEILNLSPAPRLNDDDDFGERMWRAWPVNR